MGRFYFLSCRNSPILRFSVSSFSLLARTSVPSAREQFASKPVEELFELVDEFGEGGGGEGEEEGKKGKPPDQFSLPIERGPIV